MTGAATEYTVDGEVRYSAECTRCDVGRPSRFYATAAQANAWVTSHNKHWHPSLAAARLTEERKARERAAALRADPPLSRQAEVDLYPRTRVVRAHTLRDGDVVVLTRGAPQRVVAVNTRDGLVTVAGRHLAEPARTPSTAVGTFHPDAAINRAVT